MKMNAILSFVLFAVCMFIVVKSASLATKYSSKLAKTFHLSEFVVSFFLVAIISTLPEATISIISAFQGSSEFGMGTLIGSNVADLLLVFGVIAVFSGRKGIPVKSEIMKKNFFYLILLICPLLLGVDGGFSRIDGILLLLAGLSFFLTLTIESKNFSKDFKTEKERGKFIDIIFFVLSLAALIVSAYFTIEFATDFAKTVNVPEIIISLFFVSVGACLPEFLFSLKSIKTNHESLALGDILGTVITDATVVLGIVAIISPFSFNPLVLIFTGGAMFLSGLFSIFFLTTDKKLTRKEGFILLGLYAVYMIIQIFLGKIVF